MGTQVCPYLEQKSRLHGLGRSAQLGSPPIGEEQPKFEYGPQVCPIPGESWGIVTVATPLTGSSGLLISAPTRPQGCQDQGLLS